MWCSSFPGHMHDRDCKNWDIKNIIIFLQLGNRVMQGCLCIQSTSYFKEKWKIPNGNVGFYFLQRIHFLKALVWLSALQVFHLLDWGNIGKWITLGGCGFTLSETKAEKQVKTTGVYFMGGCQLMEVVYSHRNMLWQRVFGRILFSIISSRALGRQIRLYHCQLTDTSYISVKLAGQPLQPSVESQDLVFPFCAWLT